ncbi:MAG: transcription antitermination factor NusB [Bacteriovoracaceae bacterium]|nr:transcription antitermination factor NusB [Bacteriovoracaceae bacterium]
MRREAREFAIQFLFHLQLPVFKEALEKYSAAENKAELDYDIQNFKESLDNDVKKETLVYAKKIILGVLENYAKIDEKITSFLASSKKKPHSIDKTILLAAFFEGMYTTDIPAKVLINEYVEIAKKFATKESAGLINALLDKFQKSL